MTKLKRIIRYGLGLLLALFLCAPAYGNDNSIPANEPPETVMSIKCKGLVNGFEIVLKTRAMAAIEGTKDLNPQVIELKPTIKTLECISETRVKVKVTTKIKLRLREVNPKTKKEMIFIACGVAEETIILEKKGAFITPTLLEKESKPLKMIPCK